MVGQMALPYGGEEAKPPPAVPVTKAAPKAPPRLTEPDTLPTAGRHVVAGAKIERLTVSPRKPIPPRLYRMGEVVEYSGKSRQTVHNYTTMGLLPESQWTRGGHRLYDESVFERLDQIAEMKAQDRSLEEIRKYFARGR